MPRRSPLPAAPVRVLRVTYVGELFMSCTCRSPRCRAVRRHHGCRCRSWAEARRLPLAEVLAAREILPCWGSDITANHTPFEAGLGAFVKLGGVCPSSAARLWRRAPAAAAQAALRLHHRGPRNHSQRPRDHPQGWRICRLSDERRWLTVGLPIGLGYVRNPQGIDEDSLNSGRYALVVANDVVPARLHQRPLYDPDGRRVRGMNR